MAQGNAGTVAAVPKSVGLSYQVGCRRIGLEGCQGVDYSFFLAMCPCGQRSRNRYHSVQISQSFTTLYRLLAIIIRSAKARRRARTPHLTLFVVPCILAITFAQSGGDSKWVLGNLLGQPTGRWGVDYRRVQGWSGQCLQARSTVIRCTGPLLLKGFNYDTYFRTLVQDVFAGNTHKTGNMNGIHGIHSTCHLSAIMCVLSNCQDICH